MTTPPAITVSLVVAPIAPNSGDTVTAVYTVLGNDATPGQSVDINGSVTVGTKAYVVVATITLPGGSALPVVYGVPTAPGLTFVATTDPATFTAVVP
jgi:hypothetical protein